MLLNSFFAICRSRPCRARTMPSAMRLCFQPLRAAAGVLPWLCLLLLLVSAQAASIADQGSASAQRWPMFRGNPGLTGIAGGELAPNLALSWTFKTGGPVKSSAAIADNLAFIGSDDGSIYALDLATGEKRWSFKTEAPVESSPLALDGKIFVGSNDAHLYALDAATGRQLWKYATGDKIMGSPNWVISTNGTSVWIVAGSYDFKLHCVEAETGKPVWAYETGNYINGSPGIWQGRTVFGGCDALLHVLSLTNGTKIKEIEAGAYIAGSGAVADGRIYIGHYENEFLCVDLNASEIVWRYKDRSFPYFSSPALGKDRVVFGGRDKKLHCAKRDTGEALWTFPTQGKVDSSPVICGDKVVFGSEDGRLYMVSLAEGKELWQYEIGEAVTGSPAVASGMVVIGSEDGSVYAFGAKPAVKETK